MPSKYDVYLIELKKSVFPTINAFGSHSVEISE